jgi:hypothetical protein
VLKKNRFLFFLRIELGGISEQKKRERGGVASKIEGTFTWRVTERRVLAQQRSLSYAFTMRSLLRWQVTTGIKRESWPIIPGKMNCPVGRRQSRKRKFKKKPVSFTEAPKMTKL